MKSATIDRVSAFSSQRRISNLPGAQHLPAAASPLVLQQIAEEIWVIDKGLKVWDGDIRSFKDSLKSKFGYKKEEKKKK